ncbi:hypothetical protein ACFUIY_40875 [Streptomyces griseorubiginosus]|uniref:hypothetical protein n=1 Tax=Streptomyces griseorubiginosus TaxID=67304 RepID=UPI00363C580D
MSNEQLPNRQDAQAPAPAPRPRDARREFAKKGALTVVGAVVSGTARAVVAHLLAQGE